jgi:hypothetical protein
MLDESNASKPVRETQRRAHSISHGLLRRWERNLARTSLREERFGVLLYSPRGALLLHLSLEEC